MKLSQSSVYLACLLLCSSSLSPVAGFLPNHGPRTTITTSLNYEHNSDNNNTNDVPAVVPFQSPVLKQVFPALLEHKQKYGNPNIPLGSSEGRQCDTLRRLHIQNKLTAQEVEWLKQIGFTFTSLEDVYRQADFDIMFQRLLEYEQTHPNNNFQVPKKCPEDPELGAWVTGIRRLGQEGEEGVDPDHARQLNAVGFAWKSTRKCGSKFMNQYRTYVAMVEEKPKENTIISNAELLMAADPKAVGWVQAQQEALKRGKLSQTRVHYMEQLFGENWKTIGR